LRHARLWSRWRRRFRCARDPTRRTADAVQLRNANPAAVSARLHALFPAARIALHRIGRQAGALVGLDRVEAAIEEHQPPWQRVKNVFRKINYAQRWRARWFDAARYGMLRPFIAASSKTR